MDEAPGSSGQQGRPHTPLPEKPLVAGETLVPILTDFSDFLGRLQPSRTTTQKTLDTLGVEESSSPRRVLHFNAVILPEVEWEG